MNFNTSDVSDSLTMIVLPQELDQRSSSGTFSKLKGYYENGHGSRPNYRMFVMEITALDILNRRPHENKDRYDVAN